MTSTAKHRRGVHRSRTAIVAAAWLMVLGHASSRAQGGRAADVLVSDGTRRYLLGQWADGRLTVAAPCIPGPTPGSPVAGDPPPERAGLTLRTGLEHVQPRQVRIGSEEWNRVAPALLALAGQREQEQRLAPGTATRGTRFLDWLFAGTVDGQVTYYFETSRRVPSPPSDADDSDADPPSTLRVDVSGFARIEDADAVPLGTKAELRWEEDGRPRGPQRPGLRPLGILRGPEPLWLLEDLSPAGVVIRAVGTGTRRTNQVAAVRIGRC